MKHPSPFPLPRLSRLLVSGALLLAGFAIARADDFASLCAGRMAVERVYHEHRTGTKPSFEEALPRAMLEALVRADLKKETVLRNRYGVTITPALLEAEVRRIETTTRAPEILTEIKAALGGDAVRFAEVFARPIIVERLLREKFDNDDALHAPQRKAAEAARESLLAAKDRGLEAQLATMKASKGGEAQESPRWELTPRPAEDTPPPPAAAPAATQAKTTGGIYTNEATAQVAQPLATPENARDGKERKFYFEGLPGDLQKVLQAQLRQPGDVSAVIESARCFQVFVAHERNDAALTVAILTFAKTSYEAWLAAAPPSPPPHERHP